MTRMDGEVVNVGDVVYDLLFASGKVTALPTPGTMRVTFTDGRTHTYTQDGKRARVNARTLYWRDPLVVTPQKSDAQWNMIPPILRAVVGVIRGQVR